MAATSVRIHIRLDDNLSQLLIEHASRENKSLLKVAQELIEESLELREDFALSMLSQKRDVDGVKSIKHKSAWKSCL
jgi:hypothetical protein